MISEASFGSPADLGIIFVLALLIFGPKKLPEFGRQIGTALREFRKVSDEFTGAVSSVKDEVDSVYKPLILPGAHEALSTGHSGVSHPMTPVVPDPEKPKRGLTLSTMPDTPEASMPTDHAAAEAKPTAEKVEGN